MPSSAPPVAETPVEAPEPPPPLPDYSQPPCPGDNYIWTPGYWDYASAGYYWVPGVWVVAPWVGALWTPPWWGFENGAYLWHAGYWGPHIGFYGGVDYGFGYTGRGYYGAYWRNGTVMYNRAVTNVNISTVRNVYDYRVPHGRGDRVSYNGGRGGIDARPTAQESAVSRDPRTPPLPEQTQHAREAATDHGQFAAANGARPAMLAAGRPLATPYRSPAPRPPAAAEAPRSASPETRTMPRPFERPAEPPRPAPETRTPSPAERPEARPAPPETRTMPRPLERPAEPARPQVRPPEPEARPAPQPRAEMQARPAPQPRPAPQARVAPQPHPAPQARPAPQQRPAPQAHPAPEERGKPPEKK